MRTLTDLQRKTLELIKNRTKEDPITGAEVADKISLQYREDSYRGADMRSIIHALRVKGFPICAGGRGYWYAQSRLELKNYIEGLEGRINKTKEALEGLYSGYDKIESEKEEQNALFV